jgi:rhodanese-related sulfurtransferase
MLLALLFSIALHAQPLAADSPALRISYEEFRKLYDAGEVLVVDTRSEQAYRAGHIPGARLVPYNEVERHIAELKKEKRAIVTYCT